MEFRVGFGSGAGRREGIDGEPVSGGEVVDYGAQRTGAIMPESKLWHDVSLQARIVNLASAGMARQPFSAVLTGSP